MYTHLFFFQQVKIAGGGGGAGDEAKQYYARPTDSLDSLIHRLYPLLFTVA